MGCKIKSAAKSFCHWFHRDNRVCAQEECDLAARATPPRQCHAWRRLSPRDSPALPRSLTYLAFRAVNNRAALFSQSNLSARGKRTEWEHVRYSHYLFRWRERELCGVLAAERATWASVACGLYHSTRLRIEMGSGKESKINTWVIWWDRNNKIHPSIPSFWACWRDSASGRTDRALSQSFPASGQADVSWHNKALRKVISLIIEKVE